MFILFRHINKVRMFRSFHLRSGFQEIFFLVQRGCRFFHSSVYLAVTVAPCHTGFILVDIWDTAVDNGAPWFFTPKEVCR